MIAPGFRLPRLGVDGRVAPILVSNFEVTQSVSHLRRNRLVIVTIALICIVPFGLAWYLAKNPQLVQDREKVNYGHLITPARPMAYEDFFAQPLTTPENLPEIKGRWVLIQVAGSECGDLCGETLHKTKQLRLMLNKELARVRRILLVPRDKTPAKLPEIAAADPTLLVAGSSEAFLQKLKEATGTDLPDGMVILMDPFANVMMWYAPGFDPYGALRDLQRLLRVSQIG